MGERFILYSPSFDAHTQSLSFFAMKLQLRGIYRGNLPMVATMVGDITGQRDLPFTQWRLEHCVTDYLMDHPPSDNWRDIWLHTWLVTVEMCRPVELDWDEAKLVRSWAKDDSWHTEVEGAYYPCPCILIADFLSSAEATEAAQALNMIESFRQDRLSTENICQGAFGKNVTQDMLDRIKECYRDEDLLCAPPLPPLSIQQRPGLPRQLIVTIGNFKERFYAAGAHMAWIISEMIDCLGGSTTWDDFTNDLFAYNPTWRT